MNLKDVYYLEGDQHLRSMLMFFEMQFGLHDTATAEAQYAWGLVSLKTGNGMGALDAMSDGSLAVRLDFNWEGGGGNE